MADRPLTPKQQRFVDEYLVDLNATQAAIRAGYARGSAQEQGSRLLSYAMVAAAVARGKKEQAEATGITAKSVLTRLNQIADRCMQAQPVMVREGRRMVHKMEENEEGEMVGVYDFDSSGANRALELLGKHLKLFIEKHEHTGPGGAPISISIDTGIPPTAAKPA